MTKKEQQEDVIEGELVPVHTEAQPSSEIATASIYGTMTVGQLKNATVKMAKQRAVITEYVSGQLVDGVDYGKIHIKKDCQNKYNCTNKGHFSKSVLFKPGQEKIFSLFNLTAKLYRDQETLDMLGTAGTGVVALICKVYRGDLEIAEGRGAAKIGDNSRDANATIKIAEKRARMDACLSLGFSEFFTQDIEDPEYRAKLEGDDSAGDGTSAPREAAPASDKQKDFIVSLIQQAGYTNSQIAPLLKANGVTDPKAMSKDQASELIGKLKDGSFKRPEILDRLANVDDDGVISDPELEAARGDGDAMASLAEDRGRAAEEANRSADVVLTDEADFSTEGIQAALDKAIPDDQPF